MGLRFSSLEIDERGGRRSAFVPKLITIGLLILSILIIGAFFRNFSKLKKAKEKIAEKEREINDLKKKNEEIKNRLKEISSDSYIEKQLRDSLGMSKEGEKVVVLPDEETLKSFVPNIYTKEEVTEQTNWKKWLDFFGF
ncbi:MAG: hypothetical protein KatS3mg088_059 [Patescibacteria group bacterium]|nr:MAG: hypothetical protein KatS3mg088_059 [Patescibacteria group bacterium]